MSNSVLRISLYRKNKTLANTDQTDLQYDKFYVKN